MSTKTPASPAEIEVSINPFPGLRPFDFDESHLFFGREGQSEQLIEKLSRTRFLAVVGTSGSGKSSLVRAGFLPALRGGFMTSAGSAWRVAIFRPGNDPIGNLARALNTRDVFGSEFEENAAIQTAIAESTLRRGNLGLAAAVRQAVMAENENLLVVVDQFEEVFRFARVAEGEEYANEAAAFIKLLLESSSQRELPIYVVLTMRSDYLGDCSQFWGLPEAINESQYLTPRLTRDQLREAICGPVAVGGGKITPRLVNRTLNEVGDRQDQLPVLQHLLMRTWDEWNEKRLTIETREEEGTVSRPHKAVHEGEAIDLCCADAVGGMAQALSRHADEAYNELPNEHLREVAEKLFKALTEKGPDNREIRRPITLGEICSVTDAGLNEVISVVETFRKAGRSFLMPPVVVELNSESLVDISHESLIRGWTRLKEWVDEEARSARIYRRLAETAVLHKEGGAGLWRDPDLQNALTWRAEGKPNEVWARRYHPEFVLAEAFLDESVTARDAQLVADEEQRRKEIKIKRTRLTAVILGVAFLFALAMGAYAYDAKGKAESAKDEAVAQQQLANLAKNDALAQQQLADAARNEAVAQQQLANKARNEAVAQRQLADAARNDALAQKRLADAAKTEAFSQREKALEQFDLATSEVLKGQALGALKEQKTDEAIRLFGDLIRLYQRQGNPAGEAYALASIADIHRDQVPLALYTNNFGQDSGTLEDPDDQSTEALKRYLQVVVAMGYSNRDDEAVIEEFVNRSELAINFYNQALEVNKRNTRPIRYSNEADILKNLGDLQIGLVGMKRELQGSGADKEAVEREIPVEIERGIKYYSAAREAYRYAKLHSEEGEVLTRIADFLSSDLLNNAASDANKPDPAGFQQSDPIKAADLQRVITYYEQANAAFLEANRPLLQAAVLARLGEVHERIYKDRPVQLRSSIPYFERARELYRNGKNFRREAIIDEKLAQLYGELPNKNKELAFYKEAFVAHRWASLESKSRVDSANRADELLKKIGHLLFDSSGKEEANSFFEEAIGSSGSDPLSRARILGAIGDFYVEKTNVAEAVKYYGRKREIWRQAGNVFEEGNTLFLIGTVMKESDGVAAASAFDAARKAYGQIDLRTQKNPALSVQNQNLMSIAASYVDKQEALATYEEALKIQMLSKYTYEIQQTLKLAGAILLEMNTDEGKAQAQQLFRKVLDFYVRDNNVEEQASTLSAIGDLYKARGEKIEARTYYDKSRSIYLPNRNVHMVLSLLKQVGDLEASGSPGKGDLDYYLREAESATQAGDPVLQGASLQTIGNFYRDAKDKQKAIDYYDRARLAYQIAGLKSAASYVLTSMSYLYEELGNTAKAQELLKLADELMISPRQ